MDFGGRLDREAERGRIFLWSPVAFGAGAIVYLNAPHEPQAIWLGAFAFASIVAAILLRGRVLIGMALIGLSFFAAGLFAAKLRADAVDAPILSERRSPTRIEGVVRRAEKREKGVRLTLDVVTIGGLHPSATPARAQVTWRGDRKPPRPGARMTARALLFPPPGPVEPGAYHYGRDLYFRGIGATGFLIGEPTFSEREENGFFESLRLAIVRFRMDVAARIMRALPGETGPIAAALLAGERAEISKEADDVLRVSGLSHILSISGLHMTLFAGVLYAAARLAFAAFPGLALRRPIRGWAAAIGLGAAAFYLLLSGGGAPAERSFIMIAIMFAALIAGRRALTMRNVALAALAILATEPESVLSASFQMSFAATIALIAAYESPAGAWLGRGSRSLFLLPFIYVFGLAATSLVAGSATGLFGIFHFHTITSYGLIGNLLASPVIGVVVMPAGMVGLALMPVGLERWPLAAMGLGLDGVLIIARMVAAWPGATLTTLGLTSAAVVIGSFSGLWLCLWSGSWRLIGVAGLALALPFGAPGRPDVIVEADGRTLAVRQADGRLAVAGLKSGKFAVERWLEADADGRTLDDPSLLQGVTCAKKICRTKLASGEAVILALDRDDLERPCREAIIFVTPWRAPNGCEARVVIDAEALARGGAHAVDRRKDGSLFIRSAFYPHRLWDRKGSQASMETHPSERKTFDDASPD